MVGASVTMAPLAPELHQNRVKVRVIGERSDLDPDIRRRIEGIMIDYEQKSDPLTSSNSWNRPNSIYSRATTEI